VHTLRQKLTVVAGVVVMLVLIVTGLILTSGPQHWPAAGATTADPWRTCTAPGPCDGSEPTDPAGPGPGGSGKLAVFRHPGVLVGAQQLDFVRGKVDAGEQPWRAAYDQMRGSPYASLSWTPKPRAVVDCGTNFRPDNGCGAERDDALAAYTDALIWYLSRDAGYAAKAIEILNAWPPSIQQHTNSNAPLQASWAGATFARAAELIRYSGAGWPTPDLVRFAAMLRAVYLPMVRGGKPLANGNLELAMTDAASSIAVFLDDRAEFSNAITIWRGRVPAYIYLSSDGALPTAAPNATNTSRAALVTYWQGQSDFTDFPGIAQETCRDFGHTGWGFDAAAHVASTAWVQGIDLYAELRPRMTAALEFHARYDLGAKPPATLCRGAVHTGLGPVLEIPYNHYHRLGLPLAYTWALIQKTRPAGASSFIAWETLTHAENPYG
jgi:hypothetical protein